MAMLLFYLFGGLAVLFTALVVLLRNPVTSALSLAASFFAVAAVFVLLHAPFLAVIQVLVYAGAILVLFLYVVMLLDLRKEREGVKLSGRILRLVGLGLIPLALCILVPYLRLPEANVEVVADSFGSMASVGKGLLGPYALAFEGVTLVLLGAMIGVIVLAPNRKEGES